MEDILDEGHLVVNGGAAFEAARKERGGQVIGMPVKFSMIVNGADLAIAETGGGDIYVNVFFPGVQVGYFTKEVPTLDNILDQNCISKEYKEFLKEKEAGVLRVEVKSENEGNEYCYDVVNKNWHYIKSISGLRERRERLEEFNRKYSQAEKRFSLKQKKKCIFLLLDAILIGALLLLDIESVYSTLALLCGIAYGLFMCLNLLFSRIQFEETGGYMYFCEENDDSANPE